MSGPLGITIGPTVGGSRQVAGEVYRQHLRLMICSKSGLYKYSYDDDLDTHTHIHVHGSLLIITYISYMLAAWISDDNDVM